MFLIDKYLNGLDRSKREVITSVTSGVVIDGDNGERSSDSIMENFNSTLAKNNSNSTIYNHATKLQIAQSQTINNGDKVHISGTSYQQMTNSKNLFGAKAGGPDGKLFTEDDNIVNVDPTAPNTWFNNTVTWGKSYGQNLLETFVDKAKLTPIPGLGISFNEAQSALESKNVITALGLIRKGINDVTNDYVYPSQLLDKGISTTMSDNIFREYLRGIVKSEATSEPELALQEAANTVLNDDGTWEKIKDFSKATDLVGEGMIEGDEINSLNNIKGGLNYMDIMTVATGGDYSKATNLVGTGETNVDHDNITDIYDQTKDGIGRKISQTNILEGIPSSKATNTKIQN